MFLVCRICIGKCHISVGVLHVSDMYTTHTLNCPCFILCIYAFSNAQPGVGRQFRDGVHQMCNWFWKFGHSLYEIFNCDYASHWHHHLHNQQAFIPKFLGLLHDSFHPFDFVMGHHPCNPFFMEKGLDGDDLPSFLFLQSYIVL